MLKKILIAMLTLVPIAASAAFPDVQADYEYKSAIESLQFMKILQGFPDGSFRPLQQISRAEFTKIVIAATFSSEDIDACQTSALPFTDIDKQAWYSPYFCIALREGIVEGYADQTLRPGNPVILAEAAKIFAKAYDLTDLTDAHVWYRPYLEAMERKRIIPATISTLDQPLNRGEMAEMIYRLELGWTMGKRFVHFLKLDPANARVVQKLYYNKKHNYTIVLPHDVTVTGDDFGGIDPQTADRVIIDNVSIRAIDKASVGNSADGQRVLKMSLNEYMEYLREKNPTIAWEDSGVTIAGHDSYLFHLTSLTTEIGSVSFEPGMASISLFTDGTTKYMAIIHGHVGLFGHLGNQFQKDGGYGLDILRQLRFTNPPSRPAATQGDAGSISRNIQRLNDMKVFKDALYALALSGQVLEGVPEGTWHDAKPICQPNAAETACREAGGIVTTALLSIGIEKLPNDPANTSEVVTGYLTYVEAGHNGTQYVLAPHAELGEWLMF
jgi:hypothetical protein